MMLDRERYRQDDATGLWMRPGYGGIAYSDGTDTEARIGAIVQGCGDLSLLSAELRPHCTDWPSLYHLGAVRANILRPFARLLPGADVLEIGAGCGAITRFLGESGARVLALEGSPVRARIARSRTRDLQGVQVLAERFDDLQTTHRFDVVTLIGVLEYANLFTGGEEPHLAMLRRACSLLKPGGRLLIAIENQLGLKYFAGAPEDHLGQPMHGIEGRYAADEAQTFGRAALARLLRRAGFATSEFLAPFPDYKLPVSIVSEAGAASGDFDAAALAWQSVRQDPQLPESCHFAPERAWPVVASNGLLVDLANSFLVCATPAGGPLLQPGELAWHFSTGRREPYCKEVRFVRAPGGAIEVHSRSLASANGVAPAQAPARFALPATEPYRLGEPLLLRVVRLVGRPGWSPDQVGAFLLDYLEVLAGALGLDRARDMATPQALLPGEAFDLTPQNIIVLHEGGHAVIDREWTLDEPIELGHLLLRSLLLVLNTVTRFALPQGGQVPTREGFVLSTLASIGMPLQLQDVERYLVREGAIRRATLGADRIDALEWEAGKPLPVLGGAAVLHERLAATEAAKDLAESLALQRLDELAALRQRLEQTEAAKAAAEAFAHANAREASQLREQLAATAAAKGEAERLALKRLAALDALALQARQAQEGELAALRQRLEQTEAAKAAAEAFAHANAREASQLREQLAATAVAKGEAERLALKRLAALDTLALQARQAQEGAASLAGELEALQFRLQELQVAKDTAEGFAIERLRRLSELERALHDTAAAKEAAERLAIGRLAELGEHAQRLDAMAQAKTGAEQLAIERLELLEKSSAHAAALAAELGAARAQLTALQAAHEAAEGMAAAMGLEAGRLRLRQAKVAGSRGYKVLKALRAVPGLEDGNHV